MSNIPTDLKETDRWVCWEEQMRDGKATKVPKSPVAGVDFASTNDSDTWSSFSDAIKTLRSEEYDGIGFVFTTEGEYVGVDLDDCRDPEAGEFQDWAVDVMDTLDSFTEISPSGTGSHVIVKGSMPDGRKRRGDIEMYEDGRYFTVTGKVVSRKGGVIDEPRPIVERGDELREVAEEYLYDDENQTTENQSVSDDVSVGEINIDPAETGNENTGSGELKGLPEEDQDRLKKMFRRKQKAYNLWNGSTAGYPSQSEADQALCNHLAYWLDKSARRIDRAFRHSRLYRDKWDNVHYSDGSTYGEGTIKEAIKSTGATYSSDRKQNEKADTEEEMNETDRKHRPQTSSQSDQSSTDEQSTNVSEPDSQEDMSQSRNQQSDSQQRRGRSRGRSRSRGRGEEDTSTQSAPESDTQANESSFGDSSENEEESETDRRRGRSQVSSLIPDDSSDTESTETTTEDVSSGSAESDSRTPQSNGSVAQPSNLNIPDPDDLDDIGNRRGNGRASDSHSTKSESGTEQQEASGGNEDTGSTSFFDSYEQGDSNRTRGQGSEQTATRSQRENRGSKSQGGKQEESQRASTNGKRQIPTASQERVRELGFKIDELEEKIEQVGEELQNEHVMTQQNVQDTIDELRHYEDIVDNLDGQVRVLSILIESLCKQIETPAAQEIASVAQDLPTQPSEIPPEALDQNFGESVSTNTISGGDDQANWEKDDSISEESEEEDGGFIDALKNIGGRDR